MIRTSNCVFPVLALAFVLAGCGAQQAAAPTPPAQPTAAAAPTQPAPPTPAPTAVPTTPPTAEPTAVPTPAAVTAYLLDADGMLRRWSPGQGQPVDVATLPEEAFAVSVAPGGMAVAFVVQGRAVVRDLASGTDYDITPAGLERLPESQPITGFRWSPDGQTLLFDLDQGADPLCNPEAQIYAAGLAAAPARPLGPGMAPVWSPDGTRVAYAGPPFECTTPFGGAQGGKLTVAAADLSGARVLEAQEGIHPVQDAPLWHAILWSADGKQIAAGAAVYDAATGAVLNRVAPDDGEYIGALWHLGPDGGLGYWRNVRADDPAAADDPGSFIEYDQFISQRPDGRQIVLARTGAIQCPCLALGRAAEVAWTPDGTAMLLVGQIDGDERRGLWRYDGRFASAPEFLAPLDNGGEVAPLIAPDGSYALITQYENGQPQALAFPLDGGPPALLGANRVLGWR